MSSGVPSVHVARSVALVGRRTESMRSDKSWRGTKPTVSWSSLTLMRRFIELAVFALCCAALIYMAAFVGGM